jgi:hypothetical protein
MRKLANAQIGTDQRTWIALSFFYVGVPTSDFHIYGLLLQINF